MARRVLFTGDRGSGLFSMCMGLLVFLVFLLFATHTLVGLYARSAVAGAAFDGAQYMARHGGTDEQGARGAVEGQLNPASILNAEPVAVTADYVEYRVVITAPRFLSQAWIPGGTTIERRARVRIERRRR